MSQLERIFYIDKKIQENERGVTIAQIVKKFEISERQVKRDIEYMRDRLSVPISYSYSTRSYVYDKEYKELSFANQEVVISYLALKSILQNKQYLPLYKENFLSNIEEQIPRDYRKLYDRITYQLPQAEIISSEFFEDLCTSMNNERCVQLKYLSLKGELTERNVEVHHLVNYSGQWYIIAFDKTKNDIRTFKLSRIKSISLLKDKFQNHSDAFYEELKVYMNNGFGIFYGKKTQRVKIKFYDVAARIVSTQIWHSRQKLFFETEKLNGKDVDCVVLEFKTSSFTELVSKILSFGANAVPLEPEELVAEWKNQIDKMKAMSELL